MHLMATITSRESTPTNQERSVHEERPETEIGYDPAGIDNTSHHGDVNRYCFTLWFLHYPLLSILGAGQKIRSNHVKHAFQDDSH